MLMVKPALAYGDLIAAVKRATGLPVAAYNVSGEYAMVKAAAAAGTLDEREAVLEILTSLRRAGADTIITYHAQDAADGWLSMSTAPDGILAADDGDAEAAQPQGRRRGPARRRRPAAAEPDAGLLPDRPATLRARGRAGRDRRGGGDGARAAPARQAHHPPGHADLRHARARLLLDAGRREGRSRASPSRRADHQRAPGRLAQLPAQPRVQPVVHDRHRARLASSAWRARWRCSRARRAPSRCASCRR